MPPAAPKGLLRAVIDVRRGEVLTTLLASGGFFLILCSYFMLRPVREAMGIERNFDDLYWLWIGTLLGMVAANALFALLASKIPTRVLASFVYRLFALSLVAFILVLARFPTLLREHFMTVPWVDQPLTVGHVFYIWLSVFNLFETSLFWSQASARFTLGQAKRLFPALAAGGTVGALAGSWITLNFGERVGPVWLMAGSLLVFRGAIPCCDLAFRPGQAGASDGRDASPGVDAAAASQGTSALGPGARGSPSPSATGLPRAASAQAERLNAVRALTRVLASPYLVGISGWMFALAIAASMLYFTQGQIIKDQGRDLVRNITLFANIDFYTQAFTLLLQLTVATALFRWLGVGKMLLLCPLVVVACFGTLGVWPTYGVIAIYQALFRAARYAITRPARESLFVVLSTDEKYVSKAALDTFVYRAGDVAGSLVHMGLKSAGASLMTVLALVAPVAAVWGVLGLWLGRRQKRLAGEAEDVGTPPASRPSNRDDGRDSTRSAVAAGS